MDTDSNTVSIIYDSVPEKFREGKVEGKDVEFNLTESDMMKSNSYYVIVGQDKIYDFTYNYENDKRVIGKYEYSKEGLRCRVFKDIKYIKGMKKEKKRYFFTKGEYEIDAWPEYYKNHKYYFCNEYMKKPNFNFYEITPIEQEEVVESSGGRKSRKSRKRSKRVKRRSITMNRRKK